MSQFWLTHGDRMKIGRSNPCWVLGTLQMLREKWKKKHAKKLQNHVFTSFFAAWKHHCYDFRQDFRNLFWISLQKRVPGSTCPTWVLHDQWHRPPGSRSSSWSHVGGFMWFQLKNIETYLKNTSWSVWVNKIFSKCKGWNFLQQICVYNVFIIYYIL